MQHKVLCAAFLTAPEPAPPMARALPRTHSSPERKRGRRRGKGGRPAAGATVGGGAGRPPGNSGCLRVHSPRGGPPGRPRSLPPRTVFSVTEQRAPARSSGSRGGGRGPPSCPLCTGSSRRVTDTGPARVGAILRPMGGGGPACSSADSPSPSPGPSGLSPRMFWREQPCPPIEAAWAGKCVLSSLPAAPQPARAPQPPAPRGPEAEGPLSRGRRPPMAAVWACPRLPRGDTCRIAGGPAVPSHF